MCSATQISNASRSVSRCAGVKLQRAFGFGKTKQPRQQRQDDCQRCNDDLRQRDRELNAGVFIKHS